MGSLCMAVTNSQLRISISSYCSLIKCITLENNKRNKTYYYDN